jgi:hypothetical protein
MNRMMSLTTLKESSSYGMKQTSSKSNLANGPNDTPSTAEVVASTITVAS